MAKCANKVWDSSVWINMNICPEICGASVLWESEFSFYFCSKSLKIDFWIRGKGGSKKKLEVVSNFCIVFSEIDPVSSNANRMQNYCHATFREVSDEKKAVVQKMQVLLQKEIISSQNIFLHNLFCLSMLPVCAWELWGLFSGIRHLACRVASLGEFSATWSHRIQGVPFLPCWNSAV